MCKKILILFFICFQFLNLSYASYVEDSLKNIELKHYGRTYVEESIGSRLIRLETDFFGMAQSGSVEQRLYSLEKMAAVNKFVPQFHEDLFGNRSYYSNEENPSKIKQFFNTITSPFTSYGTVTGYTPPLNGVSHNYSYSNRYCPHYNNYHPNHHHSHKMNNLHHPNSYNNYYPTSIVSDVLTKSAIKILD